VTEGEMVLPGRVNPRPMTALPSERDTGLWGATGRFSLFR
jgi:hypothetical protein